MATNNTHKPASLKEFEERFTKGRLVLLPASKLIVRMRGIGFEYMVKQGKVPDPLLPLVAGRLSALLDPAGPKETPPSLREQVEQYVDFVYAVVEDAVIEPKGLKPEWLERADLQQIIGVLYMPLDELSESSFRDDPKSVEPVRDEPALEYASIDDYGGEAVGAGQTRP